MSAAYVFQAALICETCATLYKQGTDKPAHVDESDESSYHSDEWPKGPYPDGGGEADSPQHCDHCGVFLDNPLTEHGEAYLEELFDAFVERNEGSFDVLRQWRMAYPWVWERYSELRAEEQKRFDRLD